MVAVSINGRRGHRNSCLQYEKARSRTVHDTRVEGTGQIRGGGTCKGNKPQKIMYRKTMEMRHDGS